MAAVAVLSPSWYNYKPIAKEIKVTCYQGKYVDIDFEKFLIQGANPASERYLMGIDKFLVHQPADNYRLRSKLNQRGFLNSVRTTSNPVHGTFYKNMEHGKIRYIPHAKFQGIDCFRFVITTSWQSSDEHRVMVYVIPAPSLMINVHRLIGDASYFKYSARIINKVPMPTYYYFLWYEFVPVVNYTNNRAEVVSTPRLLCEPTTSISSGVFTISDNGSITPWIQRYWPDPLIDRQGYLAGTNTVYNQPPGPYPILVRCVMFDSVSPDPLGDPNVVLYDNVDELYADSNQAGFSWWRSGPQIIWQSNLT